MSMYLVVNIIGLLVFLAIGVLFSKNRKQIQWKSIIIMVVLNLVLAWFLTSMSIGRDIVSGAAAGFNWLVQVAYVGIEFALPSWVHVKSMDFVTSALLPILLIVPLFDILTYIVYFHLLLSGSVRAYHSLQVNQSSNRSLRLK